MATSLKEEWDETKVAFKALGKQIRDNRSKKKLNIKPSIRRRGTRVSASSKGKNPVRRNTVWD